MKKSKILLILAICLLFAAYFYFDLGQYLTLESIKAWQIKILQDLNDNYALYLIGFSLIYITATALSFPGAALLTLLGGGLFGVVIGTLVVSVSSTLGATISFWSARFLLKESVETKFASTVSKINSGVEKEGGFFLFGLRLVPVFPFFMVNLLMGLTNIKTTTYMWVSALGMLPGTIAYVNAGTQLSQIDSLKGLLSPGLIGAFVFIGILPVLSKKLLQKLNSKNT